MEVVCTEWWSDPGEVDVVLVVVWRIATCTLPTLSYRRCRSPPRRPHVNLRFHLAGIYPHPP